MKTEYKAGIALLTSTILGAFIAIVSKIALREIGPFTVLFFRFLIAAITISPFVLKSRPWRNKYFRQLLAVSVLSTANTALFIWGIQFTSATVSQIIYAAMPLLIIFISTLVWKERFPLRKILGVTIGLVGIIYIVYLSIIEKGTTISGSLKGNVAIILAMFSWMFYIILSKRISKFFSPITISGVSVFSSCIIGFFLFLGEYSTSNFMLKFNTQILVAVIYLGLFGSTIFYILYQYGIKYSSALTASLTSYLQPIFTAILAMLILNEKLTFGFTLGCALVFIGIFVTTTLEIRHRNKIARLSLNVE